MLLFPPEVVPIGWTLIQERIFSAQPTSTLIMSASFVVRVEAGRTIKVSLLHQCPPYGDYFGGNKKNSTRASLRTDFLKRPILEHKMAINFFFFLQNNWNFRA